MERHSRAQSGRAWAGSACSSSPLLPSPAPAASRVKDIADFEGVRTNMLVGYGLVVGLNGTGDSLRNSMFTQESLVAMLERLGVSTRGSALNTKNVAAVMVTATLPPFARQGSRIDVVGELARRFQVAARRHAAGDAAAGRRRRGLCRGAGPAERPAGSRPRATPRP